MSPAPFVVHGATVALVWLLATNALLSAIAAAIAPRLLRRRGAGSPALWLGLRLLPAIGSIAFVVAIVLPSYWQYEPREFVEGFDPALAALAVVAMAICAAAVVRGAFAWGWVSRRRRAWLRKSTPLALPGTAIRAYQLDVDTPMMALVGVRRPCLFVTRGVLDALTGDELVAAVAHEVAHWRAADNLKRLAMRSAPDLFTALPIARAVERRWASAAEHAADRRVADAVDAADATAVRYSLASALVKVAKLMPPMHPATVPISTLVDGGDVESRVHGLLADLAPVDRARFSSRRRIALAAAAATAVLAYSPLLQAVHLLTELIVRSF
jgi:hypothetical protein